MKPDIIIKLEKELNRKFEKVEFSEITGLSLRTSTKYSTDANENVNGLKIISIGLNKIPKELITNINLCKSLILLDLSNNEISDISALQNFIYLEHFNIYGNKISDISALRELKNLIKLSLDGNKISDISALRELKNLEKLSLNRNNISDISSLKKLTNLKELYLVEINIFDISVLRKLKNLLYKNKILDISVLKNLINIERLYLENNEISDISSLKELKNIRYLSLRRNQISDISILNELENLEYLFLNNNQISDISTLKELRNLIILNLNSNKISNISALKEFNNLEKLLLRNNRILDISVLKELENLKTVDLQSNSIKKIPKWICDFPKMEVKWIYYLFSETGINIYNNQIENLPLEIVMQGDEAIREYFELTEKEGEEYLFETKVLIIGDGGVGKTSFVKKMIDTNNQLPNADKSTLGVDICKFDFKINHHKHGEQKMFANFWDFGGQKLYKGTHQMFFSKKSFYVLLDDTREEKTDFAYWINTVKQLGGRDSRLLIVLNKKLGHTTSVDKDGLLGHFGELIIGFEEVDLKNDKEQIIKLQNELKHQLQKLPEIGKALPKSWVDIRKDLNEINDNYITNDKYIEICKQNNADITKLDLLSETFNRIGVFTHYYKDEILQERVYLNTDWLLENVYEVLNNKIVKENKGRIKDDDIKNIWKNSPLGNETKRLKRLMHKFGLMYKVNNENNYVVPSHLSIQKPYPIWEHEDEPEILQFIYQFDKYMPKGIMSRLIVKLHTYIENQELVWQKGVNISYGDNTKAEITETYDSVNKYLIRIYGNEKKELLAIIKHEFETILSPFENLNFTRLVPCICGDCKGTINPHFYEYKELTNRVEKGKKSIECYKSYDDISVKDLLNGVNLSDLQWCLLNQDFKGFFDRMISKFAGISYQTLKGKLSEADFQREFHLILSENGFINAETEHVTNIGRIDNLIKIGRNVYIFEFKINNKTANPALKQIREKKYHQKFQFKYYKIFLIGVNCCTKEKNIKNYKVEEYNSTK